MANAATISYVTPAGRSMSRDVVDHSFAGILAFALTLAAKPGNSNVQVWSQGGRLLASPRARKVRA